LAVDNAAVALQRAAASAYVARCDLLRTNDRRYPLQQIKTAARSHGVPAQTEGWNGNR